MGLYINIGNEGFRRSRNSEYVDKSELIAVVNGTLFTERCQVDPTGFQNDMAVIRTKDDALTILIHLGYLSYNWRQGECFIPNREVAGEMVNAVKASNWQQLATALFGLRSKYPWLR